MIASYLLGACSDLSMGVRLEEASYKLFAGVVSLEAGKHALSGIEPDKLTEHSLKLKDRVAMLPVSTPAVRDFPWHSLQHLRSVQSKVRHLALALRTGDRDQNYVWFSIDMIP